jgi:G:T-mismatch repair DNA endonuclease (very short patch repair protein)
MHSSKRTEQQRKENSPFSVEFWKKKNPNLSEKQLKEKVKGIAKKACDDRLTSTQLEYWIEKCDGNIEQATELYKNRQTTFSKEICIKKYGEEDGLKIWEDRQHKWMDSIFKSDSHIGGYSTISQFLFDDILDMYQKEKMNTDKIFYATKNKEYFIKKLQKYYLYDFCDFNQKKFIEFNGDVYHANPEKFKSNDTPNPFLREKTSKEIWDLDKNKLDVALSNGFQVLVIWESEYKKNKETTLNKCLEFLNLK